MEQIEKMLRETMGLDGASVGSSSIQRVIRLRMKNLGISDAAGYRELLSRSRDEWDELVETVVVTETWFFRDPEAFAVVVDAARACRPGTCLRILSIPCSSGEEPYSLAIALNDAGVSPERFRIEAADLSSRALTRARNAIYSRNSFRGKNLAYRERYFRSTNGGFVLQPNIRNCVTFFKGNLLDQGFGVGNQAYDFIFCRNLLIYFDRSTQDKSLKKLAMLLAPAGTLFVGPAEQPLALEHGFVSANFSKAFACRKATVCESPVPVHSEANGDEDWKMPLPLPVALVPSRHIRETPTVHPNDIGLRSGLDRPSSPPGRAPTVADLEVARQMADAGHLKDAAAICERYLGSDTDSAQGWYLLGVIRDASGDATAADCYRKALYLKPDHYESLLQMALWLQKSGDASRARTYKARAERAKRETGGARKNGYA